VASPFRRPGIRVRITAAGRYVLAVED